MKNVIGLFGTCGGSTWRDAVMQALDKEGAAYFNPQVENWTPECAAIEAEHLAQDSVLLFAVTGETYAAASLAEIGLAAAKVTSTYNRVLIVYVEPEVSEALKAKDTDRAKDSNRARKLVREHLTTGPSIPGVALANSFEEATLLALSYYNSQK